MNIFVFIIAAIILIPMLYGALKGAPLIFTPSRAVELMIEEADLSGGEIAYDLGAGFGRFIKVADKKFDKVVYGIEITPLWWAIGKISLFVSGIETSRLKLGNFYNLNFSEIDTVFCFLRENTVENLKHKIEDEGVEDIQVLSYAFDVEEWSPSKVIREKALPPIYVYHL